MSDEMVDHPRHYGTHPSGVECIEIVENLDFCLGNAIKYIFRRNDKGVVLQDLKKAKWYVDREIDLWARDGGCRPGGSKESRNTLRAASMAWLGAEPASHVRDAFAHAVQAEMALKNSTRAAIAELLQTSSLLSAEIDRQEFNEIVEAQRPL